MNNPSSASHSGGSNESQFPGVAQPFPYASPWSYGFPWSYASPYGAPPMPMRGIPYGHVRPAQMPVHGAPYPYSPLYAQPWVGYPSYPPYPGIVRGADMRGILRRRPQVETMPWQGFRWPSQGPVPLQGGPEAATARPAYAQFLEWARVYPRSVAIHGSRTGKAVALTFDNAPDPVVTPRILQILAAARVQATFCCIGNRVEQYPNLAKRMVTHGHQIVSHSFSHPNFCRLTETEIGQQLEDTSAIVQNATGMPISKWFRPPYGVVNEAVIRNVSKRGYRTLLWDVDSLDWAGLNGYQIAANVLGHAQAGSIIVMNCGDPRTYIGDLLQAIRYIISGLKQQGYEFKTISGMAASG